MLLHTERVSKQYDDDVILRDVSLDIEIGESVVVMGPSGSGKSTLLSILGLLLLPTEGTVTFQGADTARLSDDARSRLRNLSFGYIFQHPQLIASLSVLENVLVPARLARKAHLEQHAAALLERLGLSHRLAHLPGQLSIGQKRRVAVARALLLDPVLVLADEPTNDLDPESAACVSDFLHALPHDGRALLMATHDPVLGAQASRLLRIDNNRLKEGWITQC
jgi:ABC-type lipoprotein export system ATPase subunit